MAAEDEDSEGGEEEEYVFRYAWLGVQCLYIMYWVFLGRGGVDRWVGHRTDECNEAVKCPDDDVK